MFDFDTKGRSVGRKADTKLHKAVIEDLLNTDLTQKEIAQKHEVSPNTVYNIKRANKIVRRRRKKQRLSPRRTKRTGRKTRQLNLQELQERDAAIVQDLETTSLTVKQIAEKHDLTPGRVHQLKRDWGIERPAQRKRRERNRAILEALERESATSARVIADRFGVSPSLVAQIRTRHFESVGKQKRARTCIRCLAEKLARFFDGDSEVCRDCLTPSRSRESLADKLDRIERRPRLASQEVIKKRTNRVRDFHQSFCEI